MSVESPLKWLESLRRLASSLSRMGVDGSMDRRSAKRIVLGNRLSVSVAILCLPYSLAFPLLGKNVLGVLALLIHLGFLCVPALNRLGHTWASRIWYVTLTNAALFGYSIYLGSGSGMHLLFFPLGWSSLALFNWSERKSLAYGALLNMGMLLAFETFSTFRQAISPFPHSVERVMYFSFLTAALVIQGLAALYFFLGNHRTERALARTVSAAEAADRAKSQFLANMSHEIRTPLNGILGISNLLLKYGSARDARKSVLDIRNSAQDLLAIVNEILDLSKIEAGKVKLDRIDFDLRRTLDSVLEPFAFDAGKKGVTLGLESGSEIPSQLSGDPARLKQVLRNLIGNALKFTPSGSITLKVWLEGKDSEADPAETGKVTLTFEVIDSGIGIPDEARDRIFRSFSQADASIPHKYGGTGLGLFICKQFVELMGGEIGFRSQEGNGSTFHFTLPFGVATGGRAMPSKRPGRPNMWNPDGSTPGSKDVQILIVEDHPINSKVLEGLLESYGFSADHASNGKEAVEAFESKRYDLVFMDCHMPVMDGFECTRRLREKPGLNIRIVGVTADAMPGSREKCLVAGMDEVLTKPLDDDEVYQVLAGYGGGKADETESAAGRTPESEWIDRGQVRNMAKKLRPGFIPDTLGEIRMETLRLITLLRPSSGSTDFQDSNGALHELKGMCLTLGLVRMADLCGRLEAGASNGDLAESAILLAELENALEPSLEELGKAAEEL